jgi:hypothetical protein
MYPDFQYIFETLTRHSMPSWLGLFKTFGFFVAIIIQTYLTPIGSLLGIYIFYYNFICPNTELDTFIFHSESG